jgi:RNA polymerase sigma factor (sigma-70 family)
MRRKASAKLEKLNNPLFVKALKDGTEAAYRELIEEFFPLAKSFVQRKYEVSPEDAKDILQDFAQRLIERLDDFDETSGRFVSWAFAVLRNLAVDWLRRNRKVELVSVESTAIDEMTPAPEEERQTGTRDDLSPLEKLPVEVRTAFLKLKPRYQQFLGLMLLGTSDRMIKKIMEIENDGALWTLRSRALAGLKKEVEKTKGGLS